MRKRFPTIMRVLLALALVASLVAITAAPVSAQTVNTVTPSPATASAQAGYTVNIKGHGSPSVHAGRAGIS